MDSTALAEIAARCVRIPGGSLVILHVWDPGPPTSMGIIASEKRRNTEHALAAEQLIELEHHLHSTEFSVSSRLLRGDPAAAILDCVHETGCDLLVIGTHGRSGLKRFVLGSVAETLVRRAECLVLVVPRGILEANLRDSHPSA